MSEIKVNSIKGVAASTAALTINNTDGTCTANLTNKPNRNILMNGAMLVAQRGTSSTSNGYQTIDRFAVFYSGTDEAPTQAQVDLTSSDTPYSLGFRKALKVTNGNQTSGAGTNDYIEIMQKFEGQDINSSGWDFTSTSSFVTISFWIKSSVAQTFYGAMRITEASANKQYVFAINATTSWQKITKTIPGASGLNPVNTNGLGGWFDLIPFYGTGITGSVTLDQWNTVNTSAYVPDMTSTWYTTNNATLEYTGLQMEVGSVATDFEHRSFGEELALCQRYYYRHAEGNGKSIGVCAFYADNNLFPIIKFPVTMRSAPSLDVADGSSYFLVYSANSNDGFDTFSSIWNSQPNAAGLNAYSADGVSGRTLGQSGMVISNHASSYLAFSAEL